MLLISSVITFARERVGKRWNRFNSEKRCSISYANIQGKQALIEKFQNSTVMDEEVSYRPKIYYSSGPRKGEEEVSLHIQLLLQLLSFFYLLKKENQYNNT